MTAPLTTQVTVKFNPTGINEVQRGLRLVGKEGEASGRQVGMSMRQIAGGVEMIARQGKVTGEALKSIVAQGAEMAFMFGTTGPIVGALAVVGIAIYENITNRMKEARDEINKTRTAVEGIRQSWDYTDVAKKQQGVYSGEVGAIRKEGESEAAFIARSRGLEGVRAKMGELLPNIPNNILEQISRGKTSFAGLGAPGANERYNLFAALFGLQGSLETQYAEAQERSKGLGDAIGHGLVIGLQEAMKKADENSPLSLATVNQDLEWNRLLDPIRKRGMPGIQRASAGGTLMFAPIGGLDGYRTFGLKAQDIGEGFKSSFVNPLGESITHSISEGIGDALTAGFDAAFAKGGNIGDFAAAFGGSALRVLGGVFKDIGRQSLIGLSFMESIKQAIQAWNPAFGIAASLGLIALGSALQSAGANAFSTHGGGGGGGGRQYNAAAGATSAVVVNSVAPASNAVNPVVLNMTVIGKDDPTVQRQMLELIARAQRRGSTNG